jgi:CBS domain-containing protein
MTRSVAAVEPDTSLTELERELARHRVSGMPVVDRAGEVVGVVSRADVVRAVSGAAGDAEAVLAWYRDTAGADPGEGALSRMAGERAAALRVADVMTSEVLSVRPEDPVDVVAALLVARGIHRVLVTEGRRLYGLVTTLDIARAVAEHRLLPADAAA